MKKILTALLLLSFAAFGQNEPTYLLHKVAPKETLYSLVKRYNTNFATVETLNPSLANGNSDIKIGELLKFPKNNTATSRPVSSTPAKTRSTVHVVKANETVFSISKQYNVDISNLVEANKITDNAIKVGQKLIVDGATLVDMASKAPREEELRLKPLGKNMRETGIAEIIKTPNKSTKYLALHRHAPTGTNIKITNEATGHTIVAKVIGSLSEKGPDENIMIKLSPYAYYQLRPKDNRLRATVEYYLPANETDVVSK
jgi:LysM repeat protein